MATGKAEKFNELPNSTWNGSGIITALTDIAKLFIFSYSPKLGCLVSWSKNASEVLGVKDPAIARNANLFLRHVHSEDRFLLMSDLEMAFKGAAPYSATYRWIRPDTNQIRWLHCRAGLKKEAGVEADPLFEGVIVDLSQELTGSVHRTVGPDSLTTILSALSNKIFTVDNDLRLLRINWVPKEGEFNFGDPDFKHENLAIGKTLLSCFSNNEQKQRYSSIFRAMVEGRSPHFRTRITSSTATFNLEVLPLSQGGAVKGLLFNISDACNVVRLEQQFTELQKEAGLRLLATGVTHNFNNSLQNIVGQAAAIRNHPNNPELVQQCSQAIIEIVMRVSELNRQLFVDASHRGILAPVDLNLAIMTAVNRLEYLFSSGVKVVVAFGNPAPVLAKQEPLTDALEAILKWARATLQKDQALSIKTYQVSLRDSEIGELKAGVYAKMGIVAPRSGTADAMDAKSKYVFNISEHQPIPDLSRASSIVQEFGGYIKVQNPANADATISLYLPIDRSCLPVSVASMALQTSAVSPEILVIDDDAMVLQTVQSFLRDLGYSSAIADDCRSALSLVQAHQSSLQLVLLDLIMPGMDGIAVLKQLKQMRPDLKVIGFSGATPEHTRPLLEAGAIDILQKPIDQKTLKESLRLHLTKAE